VSSMAKIRRAFSGAIFVEGVNPIQNGHHRGALARSRALLICEDHESMRFLQPSSKTQAKQKPHLRSHSSSWDAFHAFSKTDRRPGKGGERKIPVQGARAVPVRSGAYMGRAAGTDVAPAFEAAADRKFEKPC
jgi:hypothetical protein